MQPHPALYVGVWLLLPAVHALSLPAAAAQAPADDTPPARALAGPGAGVTRAELAAAYLRFERACAAHPFPAGRAKEVNRAFDTASMAFFGGNFGSAVGTLNETIGRLESGGADNRSVPRRFAESLKVRIEPALLVAGSGVPVRLSATSMYRLRPDELGEPRVGQLGLKIRLRSADPTALRDPAAELEVRFDLATRDLVGPDAASEPAWSSLPPGRYELVVEDASGPLARGSAWTVAPGPFAPIRDGIIARLSRCRTSGGELNRAIDACNSRLRLLTEDPSPLRSSEFLINPLEHAKAVTEEALAIESKRDPYRRRGGDWWVGVTIPGREIPCRIYAPPALANDGAPSAPLIIALHGAGGDESMFMEGYGAGAIKRLADEHGFIVATPSTTVLQANPKHLDAVIDAVKHWYSIDPSRIYVLGHSMGGSAAGSMATLRGGTLAAVVCMAASPFRNVEARTAPIMIYCGELDPLFPPSRLRGAVENAQKERRAVDMRIVKDYGHTLLVADQLGEAVRWLLAQKFDPREDGADDAPMMMDPDKK
ncbi:MAG: dienelactone hydrolase family protein [Phycisphaerales bacterium]